MKKNINYKNIEFMVLMLLMTTGCAHKNIVKNARFDSLTLQDMKTGKERIYDCSEYLVMRNVLVWIANGDTVSLRSANYAKGQVFTPQNSHITCNYVELQRRKDKFEREQIRRAVQEEFAKQKSK